MERTTFERELQSLLNSHSKENESNTPDFLLSEFLMGCLKAYNTALKKRDKWFNINVWKEDKELEQPNKT